MTEDGTTSGTAPSESTDSESSLARNAVWVRSIALTGILFLMLLYTLYFAASLVVPVILAFLLSLVCAPVVRFLARLRVPFAAGALLVMLSVATAMAGGVYAVVAPASKWMEKAPSELRQLESKLAWVQEPIRELNETRKRVSELAGVDDGQDEAPAIRQPSFSLVETVLSHTPNLVFGTFVTLILLFFVLASGDGLLNKLVQSTPRLRDKKRVVEVVRDVQQHVSTYLATISFINLCVAAVVALAMYLLDMPNPILWGAIAGVLNYIPYLGVAITVVIVGFVSLLTFDEPGRILLPPATLVVVNIIEGQIITPIVAGRRLALSPVAVFLSIVVLGWMWGIAGVLIAVPILATIKLVSERIEPLEPIATFLGNQRLQNGSAISPGEPRQRDAETP